MHQCKWCGADTTDGHYCDDVCREYAANATGSFEKDVLALTRKLYRVIRRSRVHGRGPSQGDWKELEELADQVAVYFDDAAAESGALNYRGLP